jgi:hypothetical protein
VKKARLWVSPSYKRKIKIEAATKDMGIIEYTDFLAKDSPCILPKKVRPKKQKGGFDPFI